MVKNAYSEKYEAATSKSVEEVSIAACERAIGILMDAKKAKEADEEMLWIEHLNKLHEEIAILMEAVSSDPKYQEQKDKKLDYYFFLGIKVGISKLEYQRPERMDQIIERFQETRDFWMNLSKEGIKTSAEEKVL